MEQGLGGVAGVGCDAVAGGGVGAKDGVWSGAAGNAAVPTGTASVRP